jgi:hypothetical protein
MGDKMPHFKNYKRSVQYINRDFSETRLQLINYIKTYFPNTYGDFAEASPGSVFIELVAAASDVLNFYSDVQLQESFLYTADERINLYNLAQSMGYKARTIVPASVELDIYQLVPSIGEGQSQHPDFKYALQIKENMQVATDGANPTYFRTIDSVDFRFSSSYDPTITSVYSVTGDGDIEYYLLKKKVKAVAGQLVSANYTFGDPKIYDKIVIDDEAVVEVIDITDADGNKWYEVPFMAQDVVPISVRNVPFNDPLLSQYRSSVPYLLQYQQTERRYLTRVRKDDKYEIQFGAGLSSEADEEILPNPFNVGLGLPYFERVTDVSIDPMNFLYSKTYGSAPQNTTLTVRYSTADGLKSNVKANTLTVISSIEYENLTDSTDSVILQTIRDSVSVNNPDPAFGGQNKKPLDTVREEAIANFAAQNRAVTKEDYILRCFTMPAKFGSVCKAYVEQDWQLNSWNDSNKVPNPFALNLYVLSYNADKQFVASNQAIKENLRNYLKQYRLLTDAVNIKDCFIVNISVKISVITYPGENSNEVILQCLERAKQLFDNDKMSINAPIIISRITSELDRIPGVQTVQDIQFENEIDTNAGYSGIVYNVKNAIRNGILYPSVDPSIFEVRFPNRDIQIRVADF